MDVCSTIRDTLELDLSVKDLLNLSLVNRSIFSLARPVIERDLYFRVGYKGKRYRPKKWILTHQRYPSEVPRDATHLCLDRLFDGDISSLPSTLKVLECGWYFNQNVYSLPEGLEFLSFGHHFNRSVDRLPKSLKVVRFGMMFDKSVDRLPEGLKELHIGSAFNHHLDHLPRTLEVLSLGYCFNRCMQKLPETLKLLRITTMYNKPIPKSFKGELEVVVFEDSSGRLWG